MAKKIDNYTKTVGELRPAAYGPKEAILHCVNKFVGSGVGGGDQG